MIKFLSKVKPVVVYAENGKTTGIVAAAASPVTTDDERAARVATAEERAAAIIESMAAKKAKPEAVTLNASVVDMLNGRPVMASETAVTVTPPPKPAKAAPVVAAESKPAKVAHVMSVVAAEPVDMMDAARAVKNMGLSVEIVGCFVWAWGDTKKHRDELKALSFKWAPSKEKWYKAPQGYRKTSRNHWEYGEIRAKFGARELEEAAV